MTVVDDTGESLTATTVSEEIEQAQSTVATELPAWSGVLCIEGTPTGDGREFAPGALTWAELPVPLRWNKEDSHGGEPHTVTVNVGKIQKVWRDGDKILGSGVFNLDEIDGQRAYDLVHGEFMNGISIDADDIADSDVELIWPETGPSEGDEEENEPDIFDLLFAVPEKVIFHAGRIRAATLCDIPAFTEARITISEAMTDEDVEALTAGAVSSHATGTADGTWDGPANEKRLPSPMPVATARKAYAWVDGTGEVAKSDCKFIHHSVSNTGVPGAANLTACSSGIGILNGGRGGTDVGDKQGIWNHLAKHLRDGGREPPPLGGSSAETITAAAISESAPPKTWFVNPRLSMPTPIMVSEDGRVYGHAALWGTCHIGHPDVCVTPPHEDSHPYFMTGELTCADGTRVSVGQITVGTKHAPLTVGSKVAAEHYDHTGYGVADVVVGNDEHGIWVSGAVRPGTPPERVRELRASGQLSGDWRRIGGHLRLVGLLAVNVPGFPVPRVAARVASGQQLALVAAGARSLDRGVPLVETGEQAALRRIMENIAGKVR